MCGVKDASSRWSLRIVKIGSSFAIAKGGQDVLRQTKQQLIAIAFKISHFGKRKEDKILFPQSILKAE